MNKNQETQKGKQATRPRTKAKKDRQKKLTGFPMSALITEEEADKLRQGYKKITIKGTRIIILIDVIVNYFFFFYRELESF